MVIIEFILAFVFVCLMISLFVSWIIDYWASHINKKGELLKEMLGTLIDPNKEEEWIKKLYEHPMIKSLSVSDKRLTSYIPPKVFSSVLSSIIIEQEQKSAQSTAKDANDFNEKIKLGLAQIPDGDLKRTIHVFLNNAVNEGKDFIGEIEDWYNEYMLRVNHKYKRFIKFPLFIVGFTVALIFNIDTVRIGNELWNDAPLRNNIAGMAEQFADTTKNVDSLNLSKQFFQELKNEMGFPVGWGYYQKDFLRTQNTIFEFCGREKNPSNGLVWLVFIFLKIIGFALTGLIASFGAPFWYDALQKIIGLKKGIAAKADEKTT